MGYVWSEGVRLYLTFFHRCSSITGSDDAFGGLGVVVDRSANHKGVWAWDYMAVLEYYTYGAFENFVRFMGRVLGTPSFDACLRLTVVAGSKGDSRRIAEEEGEGASLSCLRMSFGGRRSQQKGINILALTVRNFLVPFDSEVLSVPIAQDGEHFAEESVAEDQ